MQTCLVPSPVPVGFPLSYQQGMGKRFQGRRKTKKEATRAMKSSIPYSRKKTDTLLKDVFLIPNRNLSKVPRGKERKQMYLDGLVALGVEFNINMNHEDVMRTIIDAFSIVLKISSCLGSACSPLFEFFKAVDEELTKLNPALQWNLKMIRQIAGSGPLYIRSMLDIKKSENDSSSNEDSDLSGNE